MRILWLKTELLHPVDKGGKIRTYQMLRELRKEHHITYLTLDDGSAEVDAIEKAQEYAHEVITIPHKVAEKFGTAFYIELLTNLVSPLPYFMAKYRSEGMRKAISEIVNAGKIDLIVCDFLMPSINVPDGLGVPMVLFQHNVETMIWKRHYEVAANPLKKQYMKRQWLRTEAYEREICSKYDTIIAVSADDAEMFVNDFGSKNVAEVPTGVDLEYFARTTPKTDFRKNLVFTGSMDWLPNDDAISWFVKDIFPLIKKSLPDVTLTVVGRSPSASLKEIAASDEQISVTGRVEDVRPYMQDADIFIVPIRIGGGTRLKIYEAMAMQLPIVSTTIGAEGLPLVEGDEIVLRDTEKEFADAIIDLLKDTDQAVKLGKQAYQRVNKDFGWANAGKVFGEICEETFNSYRSSPLHTAEVSMKAESASK